MEQQQSSRAPESQYDRRDLVHDVLIVQQQQQQQQEPSLGCSSSSSTLLLLDHDVGI